MSQLKLSQLPKMAQSRVRTLLRSRDMLSGNVRGKPSPRVAKRKPPTDHSLEYDPAKLVKEEMFYTWGNGGTMRTLELMVNANPDHIPTAQQKGIGRGRGGKVVVYTKTHIRNWEHLLTKALKPFAYRTKGYDETKGAMVEIEYTFPYTNEDKAEIKKMAKRGLVFSPRMHVRPDVDNLTKSTLDAIVRSGLLMDDGNVDNLHLRKKRGEKPGIKISITVQMKGTENT